MKQVNEVHNDLISVIVPVYNASPWLRECVESILVQTYHQLEIILVDDGSTDGSGEICDEYAVQDNRIRVLHRNNGGVGTARNVGLDAATGTYIGWVDADDTIEPDMFQRLIAMEADLAVCAFSTFGDGGITVKRNGPSGIYRQPQIMDVMIRANSGSVLWNKLSRRKLWEGLRFPACRVLDDEIISCSVFSRSSCLAVTDEVLYHYRIHPNSVMHNLRPEDCLPALHAACERYGEIKENKQEFSIYYLASVYNILRSCMRVTNVETYRILQRNIAPAAALVADRRQELAHCLGFGFLGLLEMAALTRNSYWAGWLSRFCQRVYDWNSARKQYRG